MAVRIINADVLEGLAQLPDESVQCCVTSPPYWGLRDYGVDGQIGMEPTPGEFIDRLVAVFREVRRVLKPDGTLWINMGDAYTGSRGSQGRQGNTGQMAGRSVADARQRSKIQAARIESGAYPSLMSRTGSIPDGSGLKPKDMIGQPWRLAFALQSDGWWLRQDIIWHKPNPMPESVTDRCTKAHEYIFLLTKSARYFYDAEAIKERAEWPDGPNSPQSIKSPHGQGFTRNAERPKPSGVQHKQKALGQHLGGSLGSNDDWGTRNKRSVWTIATAPFSEAHFATFPPELPELCIKAGSKPGDTVLDCFGGAGTTGLVADRLQRNAVLIELNPDYAAMAKRRIDGDRGGLLDLIEAV